MNIGIIGDGQLGRMLALEGMKLGHNFGFLSSSKSFYNSPCANLGKHFSSLDELLSFADVLTYESENVNVTLLDSIDIPIYPPVSILSVAQHRGHEKALFIELGIPCANYQLHSPTDTTSLSDVLSATTLPVIVKTTTQGYDGKGQYVVSSSSDIPSAVEHMANEEVIIEEMIAFDYEVSLIACATKHQMITYPLTKNTHKHGILETSEVISHDALAIQAQQYAQIICQKFNYIGILTIEFFVVGDTLYANEIAPRVHNSGHWTLDGAHTSQFENHIRAITHTPLGSLACLYQSVVMHNIISILPDTKALLSDAHTSLHLYNKTERVGRKIGHYTICK